MRTELACAAGGAPGACARLRRPPGRAAATAAVRLEAPAAAARRLAPIAAPALAALAALLASAAAFADPPASAPDWVALQRSLRLERAAARVARAASDPAAMLAAETAYGHSLAAAAAHLAAADPAALDPPGRSAWLATLRHLLAAREPAALGWLRSRSAAQLEPIDPQGEIRFWAALDAFGRQDWAAAAARLEGSAPPLVQPYAEWMRVRSLEEVDAERSGSLAREILARSPEHPFRGLLTLRAARHLLHAERGAEAQSLLERYLAQQPPEDWLRAAALTWLAETHRRAGRPGEFRRAFSQSVQASAADSEAGPLRLRQALILLEEDAGRRAHPSNALSNGLLEACIQVVSKLRSARAAHALWGLAAERLPLAGRSRTALLLVEGLYREKEDPLLLAFVQALSGEAPGEAPGGGGPLVGRGARAAAQLHAGRVYRRGSNRALMTGAFRAASLPDLPVASLSPAEIETAGQALWELGRELEDLEAWGEAEEAFAQLRGRFPDHAQAREGRLREALCAERAARRSEALGLLEAACRAAPHNLTGGPCLWRALLGETQDRSAFLLRASRETHPGYYAKRAAEALALGGAGRAADSLHWAALSSAALSPRAWPWPAARPLAPELSAEALAALIDDEPAAEAGTLFLALGHPRWARRCWTLLPGWRGLEAREQAALLRALGDVEESARAGIRTKDALARYPVAFTAEVAAAAESFGLSPAFLYAVIRQESLFAAHALSRAGAQGLMQLMPETARRTARSLGWSDYDVGRPRDNILLGAYHLAELIAATGGRLPVALAAYNAGLDRAVRWWRLARDEDDFIERIGFAETRGFVRSVLSHYAHYRSLYPASAGPGAAPGRGGGAGDD